MVDCQSRVDVELTRDESLRLLGTVRLGRLLYTQQALPAALPVCHLLEADALVIRVDSDLVGGRTDRTVVGYQTDAIDRAGEQGWTVLVTGMAEPVEDPGRCTAYQERLPAWTAGGADQILSISLELVRGHRLDLESRMPLTAS